MVTLICPTNLPLPSISFPLSSLCWQERIVSGELAVTLRLSVIAGKEGLFVVVVVDDGENWNGEMITQERGKNQRNSFTGKDHKLKTRQEKSNKRKREWRS